MNLRNILKLVVLLGVIIPLSKGISVPVNQAQAFPFLLLFLLVSILEHYLFNRNEIPSASNFSIDLGVVRSLADAEPNLLPVRVNSLIIAKGEISDWIVVAGGAPSGFSIAFTSFQLVYNDKTVIIECPFNKALYDKFCAYKLLGIKGEYFNEDNYDIMQRAMLETARATM